MTLIWVLLVLVAIFTLLTVYRNLAVLRYRLVPPEVDPDYHELVSVIIPARNEAVNIRDCVESVLEQSHRPIQIIVVDDNSVDRTADILAKLASEHPELEVVPGRPLPPGWVGKNHAISQGYSQARGEWLVFLDADTRLAPQAIGRAVALARQRGLAMMSYLPRHVLGSLWEKVVQPVVMGFVMAGAPPSAIESAKDGTAAAFGQFILFRRAAYEAIGGHEGVKNEVLEDWRMAQKIKARGLYLAMAEGQELARVRMYHSLGGLWEGWSKNAFLGADKKLPVLVLLWVVVFLLGVWPLVLLAWAVVAALQGADAWILAEAAVFHLALMFYYAVWMNGRLGMPASYALGYPLGSLVFLGILINSTFRILSGRGVTWKGRTYSDQ